MKVSKLVYTSFVTRVIVEDTDNESIIIEEARYKLNNQVNNEIAENIEKIIDDIEVPYDEKIDNNLVSTIYDVDVTRIGYSTKTLEIAAFTPEEAKQIAINIASNFVFHDKESEYVVDDIRIKK